MKDNKEIVLFFDTNTNYEPIDVAKEITQRYPELGRPAILPANKDPKSPIIIFNENPDFVLRAGFDNVSFDVNHTYFKNISSISFDLLDTFEGFNVNSVRIGYISNVFLSPSKVNVAKNKYLKMDELEDIKDFNLSWYKELEMSIGVVNCWERLITDHIDFNDLLCQYDINTPVNEKINLDMKYIKTFIKEADDYIDKRTNL